MSFNSDPKYSAVCTERTAQLLSSAAGAQRLRPLRSPLTIRISSINQAVAVVIETVGATWALLLVVGGHADRVVIAFIDVGIFGVRVKTHYS